MMMLTMILRVSGPAPGNFVSVVFGEVLARKGNGVVKHTKWDE